MAQDAHLLSSKFQGMMGGVNQAPDYIKTMGLGYTVMGSNGKVTSVVTDSTKQVRPPNLTVVNPLTLRHLLTPGRYRRRLLYVASPHASRVLSVPRRNRGPGSALVADLVAFTQIWALLLAAYSVAGLETRSEGRRRSGSAAAGSLLVHPSRCVHSFRPLNPN